MPGRKAGKHHLLLFYWRTMDRMWKAALPLGLLLAAVWFWSYELFPGLQPLSEDLIFIAASLLLAFSLFAFLSRYLGYVQAFSDHLRIVTPFIRLKLSYRRIRSIHPADFAQLHPPQSANWAQRRFLQPFFGQTALAVELTSFPRDPRLLRLFLPAPMFLKQTTGLILVVKDWMALSTEIETLRGAWRQSQSRTPSPGPGLLKSLRK